MEWLGRGFLLFLALQATGCFSCYVWEELAGDQLEWISAVEVRDVRRVDPDFVSASPAFITNSDVFTGILSGDDGLKRAGIWAFHHGQERKVFLPKGSEENVPWILRVHRRATPIPVSTHEAPAVWVDLNRQSIAFYQQGEQLGLGSLLSESSRPASNGEVVTAVALMPFTFVADVATYPFQTILALANRH